MSRAVLAALIIAMAPQAASAQDRFADVSIESQDLGDGIHMLTGLGGNLGLSTGEDGIFLIDDQFAPLADRIKAKIAELAGDDAGSVRFVVNTHFHGDHTGGNEAFAADGATIIAHENIRARLKDVPDPAPEGAWPVLTFADGVTVHLNGDTIRVRHLPTAHTDGDAIVYFEERNIVHLGDLHFNGMFPFIDLAGGGTIDGYIAAQEAALEYMNDETVIMPGHGPLASKPDLERDLAMLKAGRAAVQALIDDGASLEDVQAANPLADYAENYSWRFIPTERMTETFFTGLSGR